MNEFDAVNQKIKGKLQKAQGAIQQQMSPRDDIGTKVKGGFRKLKGSVNETFADMRLNTNKGRKRTRRENNPWR